MKISLVIFVAKISYL